MTTQIPPGYCQTAIELRHDSYARAAFVVFGHEYSAGGISSPDEMAQVVLTAFASEFQPIMDTNVTFFSARTLVGQDGGDPLIGFGSSTTKGSRNAESAPPALAVRFAKRTSLGGRRNRGSMFLPWAINSNQISEIGQIGSGYRTTLQVCATGFLEELESLDAGMALLHSTGVSVIPPPTPVNSMVLDPTISNQVRRQTRR